MIDWFDVAPAVAFAVVAGVLAAFVGDKPVWAVLLGVGYIVFAGFVAAASVGFVGIDGIAGFVASLLSMAILVAPLWLYTNASERTPVTRAEISATVREAKAILTQIRVPRMTTTCSTSELRARAPRRLGGAGLG